MAIAVAVTVTVSTMVAPARPASADAAPTGTPGPPVLSSLLMLARLSDPGEASRPLPPEVAVTQYSSHDRTGRTFDGGWYHTGWNVDQPPTYLRKDAGGMVLAEEERPGCIVRMWFTGVSPGNGGVADWGRIQILFDGEAAPRFDVDAGDFFSGRIPAFPRPLVGDRVDSSGGNYSYVPLCYSRSMKVKTTGVPPSGVGWYHIVTLSGPVGMPVETYDASSFDAGPAVAAMADAGRVPLRTPDATTRRNIAAGETAPLLALDGAGAVTHVRIQADPFDIDTLQSLQFVVTADHAPAPQIVVPLGDLFGNGVETRSLRSLAFSMTPAAQTGTFSLPIPYRDGVVVALSASRPANVTFEAWTGPAIPGAGVLFGERRQETTTVGRDYTVLEAGGSGRVASFVLDLLGQEESCSDVSFLEGDERVYVDGSRSPALYGTGTEDMFNASFYYQNGPFSLPTHGAGRILCTPDRRGTVSQYRVFGDDGPRWQRALHFGAEHGSGDEGVISVASTTFSYRGAATLAADDSVVIGNSGSESAHGLTGSVERRTLTAYFEGDDDGNVVDTTPGGVTYTAPPPEASPEGVRADGIAFTAPLDMVMGVDQANRGVVLRRLMDAGGPDPSLLAVAVDGKAAGYWSVPDTNPSKRWRVADFPLPPALTVGKATIKVTLTPATAAAENLFSFDAFSVAESRRQSFFAEGTTLAGFEEYLLLANPSDADAVATTTFSFDDGTPPLPVSVRVPAFGRTTVHVADIVGRGKSGVSMVVDAPDAVVAERAVYFDHAFSFVRANGAHGVLGADGPRRAWTFAEGSTLPGFQEYLTLLNPGDAEASITVTFGVEDGATRTTSFAVAAQQRRTLDVNVAIGSAVSGHSTRVDASEPVLVERVMYFNRPVGDDAVAVSGGDSAFGAAPGPVWDFAEGTVLSGFATYLTIANPDPARPAEARITYAFADGGGARRTATVAPSSRLTVKVFDAGDPNGVGRGVSDPVSGGVSMSVTTAAPEGIVVERPLYFHHAFDGAGEIDGGDVAVGLPATDRRWTFAEGSTLPGLHPFLTVLNPGERVAPLLIVYVPDGGVAAFRRVAVAPGSRLTVRVDGPASAGGYGAVIGGFGIVVQAAEPVIVERPMYVDRALGDLPLIEGGTSAAGRPG